jgi:uncharacterized protein with HEPN domain
VSRDPLLLLEDIEKSCLKIVRYAEGRERGEVVGNEMRLDAILFNLHVVGEAVKGLPESFRQRHKEVAWREIAGMRDFIAHAYFALDLDILWDAVSRDVPALLARVRSIISSEQDTTS